MNLLPVPSVKYSIVRKYTVMLQLGTPIVALPIHCWHIRHGAMVKPSPIADNLNDVSHFLLCLTLTWGKSYHRTTRPRKLQKFQSLTRHLHLLCVWEGLKIVAYKGSIFTISPIRTGWICILLTACKLRFFLNTQILDLQKIFVPKSNYKKAYKERNKKCSILRELPYFDTLLALLWPAFGIPWLCFLAAGRNLG